ncbi:hypothetical protein N438_00922 [Klebsiella sp. GL120222-02]|nr:hypothetical protein N438_00922 [Klebsiella sp. GL120222-02]
MIKQRTCYLISLLQIKVLLLFVLISTTSQASFPTTLTREPADTCVIPFRNESITGDVYGVFSLPDDGVLINAKKGWFRYDYAGDKVVSAGNLATGYAYRKFSLSGGGILFVTNDGLFRYDARLTQVLPIEGTDTGYMAGMLELPNRQVLIGAKNGVFSYDPDTDKVVRVGGADTGGVTGVFTLPGNSGALLTTENGIFRYDPTDNRIVPAGETGTGAVSDVFEISDGELLIIAEKGVFRYDTNGGKVVPTDGAEAIYVYKVIKLPGDGSDLLLGAGNGWFLYDTKVKKIVSVGGADIAYVYRTLSSPGGRSDVILGAANGWFRYDSRAKRMVSAGGEVTGYVTEVLESSSASLLLGAQNGLFRFDANSGQVVSVGGADTGGISGLLALPDGRILLGTENGIFRYDAQTKKVGPAGHLGILIGAVYGIYSLPRGGVLINAENGWFRYDAHLDIAVSVGRVKTGKVSDVLELPSGGVLLFAQYGLFEVPAKPFRDATVKLLSDTHQWVVQNTPLEVHLRFSHPCAPAVDMLGMRLLTIMGDKLIRSSPVRRMEGTVVNADVADLESGVTLDTTGNWTMILVQGYSQVGQPLQVSLNQPLLHRIITIWPQIVSGLGIVYIIIFLFFLWMSHNSMPALRILLDPAWGTKLLTWPVFLLRHSPAIQCWILEPWFQCVRREMMNNIVTFIDPPVRGNQGQIVDASTLPKQLSSTQRIWLQGRTGMGKSTVFAAWAQEYYSNPTCKTLKDSVRKYGFIFVLFPVRDYSAIPSPHTAHIESWVVEAIRQRFEKYGLILEENTLTAMLRSGNIAVALDGTNEADRSEAIAAFGRQYPQVKLIATSQSEPGEGWDIWRLPADISEQRAELLRLWLGYEQGTVLEQYLAEDHNSVIISGYDLRLVVDLAKAGAPIPNGRIELYRAVLIMATSYGADIPDLFPLRQLAVQMIVKGQRAFTIEEGLALGADVAAILSRDSIRIIRRAGQSWEFRHDQMRAFLAASSLADDSPTLSKLINRIEEYNLFGLRRDDQEMLWSFLGDLLNANNVKNLWIYAQNDPSERGLLQSALQRSADCQNIILTRPSGKSESKN